MRCGEYRVFAQDLHQRRAFAAADHLQKAKTIEGRALEWLGQVFIKEIGSDLPLILVVPGRQVNADRARNTHAPDRFRRRSRAFGAELGGRQAAVPVDERLRRLEETAER